MKPTEKQINKIKREITTYKSNKRKVEDFENWLVSRIIDWCEATEDNFRPRETFGKKPVIRGNHVEFDFNGNVRYSMPLESLWNPILIEEKKKALQMRKKAFQKVQDNKERALYEKLHAKYGTKQENN
jgi:hypothetical protein